MIYYDGRNWQPCVYIAKFEENGNPVEKFVKEKEYWENMVSKHDKFSSLSFEPLEFTEVQNERLEKLNTAKVSEGFLSIAKKYVETGEFPEGYEHPLASLKINKEQSDQNKEIADAFFEIMRVVN